LNIVPTLADEFLRLLIVKATGESLLIKNRKVITKLREWAKSTEGANYIHEAIKQLPPIKIAESYHRYHEYWLALKQKQPLPNSQDSEINAFINKISKLADKHNRPIPLNVMQNICDSSVTSEMVAKAVKTASDVQLLRTWRYLHFMQSAQKQVNIPRNYAVRNGTVWTREDFTIPTKEIAEKSELLVAEMRNRYSHLAGKKFYIPDNIAYPVFTSGKQTVSVVPQGTVIKLPEEDIIDENIIVAIHWFDVNGRVDLDLHAQSKTMQVGWDSQYRTEDSMILYSGDITAAPEPHGATEAILVKDEEIEAMDDTEFSFTVNNYTQNGCDVPFDIIIASGNDKDISYNCTVNPNKILIKLPAKMIQGKSQQEIGTLIRSDDGFEFIVGGRTTGNNRACWLEDVQEARLEATKLEHLYTPDFENFIATLEDCEFVDSPDKADYDLSLEGLQTDTFSGIMYPPKEDIAV